MLTLKPTDLGSGNLESEYLVLDETGETIGRISWTFDAPRDRRWFWTITARVPQTQHDKGYAASQEQAMADFKVAWMA